MCKYLKKKKMITPCVCVELTYVHLTLDKKKTRLVISNGRI